MFNPIVLMLFGSATFMGHFRNLKTRWMHFIKLAFGY